MPRECLLSVPSVEEVSSVIFVGVRRGHTLQFLHRQTKFASPLLPEMSFIS